MKKLILLSCIAATATLTASAQSAVKATVGVPVEMTSTNYVLPRTVLRVTVTAQKSTIKAGPYARFAQKYLGVTGALSDKVIYTLTGASLNAYEESDPSQIYLLDNADKIIPKLYAPTVEGFKAIGVVGTTAQPERFVMQVAPSEYQFRDLGIKPLMATKITRTESHLGGDSTLNSVPTDRRETTARTLEEMAADAADAIFTLRKRRFDLVTGEAGENVFGAGLSAAIEEMRRIEEDYLSLFLGKQFTESIERTYEVLPEEGKANAVICRFSETTGVVGVSDLSGRPVMIEYKPEMKTQNTAAQRKASKDSRPTVFYRMADIVNCKISDGKNTLYEGRVPIYQMGAIIEIPVSSVK